MALQLAPQPHIFFTSQYSFNPSLARELKWQYESPLFLGVHQYDSRGNSTQTSVPLEVFTWGQTLLSM